MIYDIIIIGSGIAGLYSANHLSKKYNIMILKYILNYILVILQYQFIENSNESTFFPRRTKTTV